MKITNQGQQLYIVWRAMRTKNNILYPEIRTDNGAPYPPATPSDTGF